MRTELPDRLKNFFTCYVLAFLLHYSEEWDHPVVTLIFMGLAVLVVGSGFRPVTLLVFSLAAHLQVFLNHFPDTANHLRVFIGCNLAVTVFSGYLVFCRPPADRESRWFAGFAPALMLALIVTYLYAGFHKLNSGFLDPEHSCARNFASRILDSFWLGHVAIPGAGFPWIAGFVYLWELVIPFFLLFRRTQAVALPVCIGMHWLLAPTGFLDFASLAWAILMLFLDDDYHAEIERRPLRFGRFAIARRVAFFGLTLAGGAMAGIQFQLFEVAAIDDLPKGMETLTGWLFILSGMMFLWPVLREIVQERKYRGVAIAWRRIHWAYGIAIGFVVLNGFQPYLGLSTGGTYSMFSNLRTEGPVSNHLLLGGNPFKVFPFQEDVVEIHFSPSGVTDHGRDLQGYDVPMVEFRKMLGKWRARDRKVLMEIRYQGTVYRSNNIWEHPDWQLRSKWYDYLLDFRVIPRETSQDCQW